LTLREVRREIRREVRQEVRRDISNRIAKYPAITVSTSRGLIVNKDTFVYV